MGGNVEKTVVFFQLPDILEGYLNKLPWGHKQTYAAQMTVVFNKFLGEEIHSPNLFTKVPGLYINKDFSAVRGRKRRV